MKIDYDPEVDALYIQFQPGKVKQSRKILEGVVLDIAKDGRIFGIEILDASRRIPLSQIGRVNVNFPISKAS